MKARPDEVVDRLRLGPVTDLSQLGARVVGRDLRGEVEQWFDMVGGIVGIPAQLDLHEECSATVGDQVLGLRGAGHRRDTGQRGRQRGQVRGRGPRLRR